MRGSKAKYTAMQKRQAEEIADGYIRRGTSKRVALARAWATINKIYGGGAKGGSGHIRPITKEPMRKGGKKGGAAAAARPFAKRSASARRAARTRARRGH